MSDTLLMKTETTKSHGSDLGQLFAQLPGVILEFDTELQCVRFNRSSSTNFTGQEGTFLEGRRLQDLLVAEDRKNGILSIFDQAKDQKEPQQFMSITTEGISLSTQIIPLIQDEEISGYMSICYEREPIASSDSKLSLFESFNDTALILNSFGEILRCNKPFMGLPEAALSGKNISLFFENEDMMVIRAAILRVIEDGSSLCFENHATVAGTPRWFSNSISPYYSENGKVVQLLLMSREISSLKNKIWELGKERQFQENVVNNITDGVMAIDIAGRITLQNPVAMDLFGKALMNIDELRSTENLVFSNSTTGEAMVFEEMPIIKALRGDHVDQDNCVITNKQSGQTRHITWTARPILENSSEIAGAVVVLRDTSEAKMATEKLVKANANLDAFVQTTAHDLKSPVLNMRHLLQLIAQTEPGDKRELLIQKLDFSVVKLDELLSALLDWVDAQRSDKEILEKVDVKEVYQSVIEDLQVDLMNSEAKLSSDFSERHWLNYNGVHLRSILFNLLSNSIKYRSPDRALEIEVSSVTRENGDIHLSVKDNGQGIDLKFYAEEIFKPFRRLTTKGEGKGIGLNLIKNFVERNGGEVKVDSVKGEGSTFTVILRSYPVN